LLPQLSTAGRATGVLAPCRNPQLMDVACVTCWVVQGLPMALDCWLLSLLACRDAHPIRRLSLHPILLTHVLVRRSAQHRLGPAPCRCHAPALCNPSHGPCMRPSLSVRLPVSCRVGRVGPDLRFVSCVQARSTTVYTHNRYLRALTCMHMYIQTYMHHVFQRCGACTLLHVCCNACWCQAYAGEFSTASCAKAHATAATACAQALSAFIVPNAAAECDPLGST
jgi:hypothetical protein